MPNGEAKGSLEDKLNTLSSKLTELEDLQLVNKLDIINLKNELEQVKLTASLPGPETLQRITELGKIVENVEEFKKLMGLVKNIDKVIAGVRGAGAEDLEDMIRVVDDIDKRLRGMETRGPGIKPGDAEKYRSVIEELKSGFEGLPKGAKDVMGLSRQLERLRVMVEENAKNMLRLSKEMKRRPVIRRVVVPPGMAAVKPRPSVLKCPQCGAALPPHARFCRKCGTKIGR